MSELAISITNDAEPREVREYTEREKDLAKISESMINHLPEQFIEYQPLVRKSDFNYVITGFIHRHINKWENLQTLKKHVIFIALFSDIIDPPLVFHALKPMFVKPGIRGNLHLAEPRVITTHMALEKLLVREFREYLNVPRKTDKQKGALIKTMQSDLYIAGIMNKKLDNNETIKELNLDQLKKQHEYISGLLEKRMIRWSLEHLIRLVNDRQLQ